MRVYGGVRRLGITVPSSVETKAAVSSLTEGLLPSSPRSESNTDLPPIFSPGIMRLSPVLGSPTLHLQSHSHQRKKRLRPIHPFMVHCEALALQQDLEPAIAKPSTGRRQLAQPLPQTRVFDPSPPIPACRPRYLHQPAGASLRNHSFRAHHFHRLPLHLSGLPLFCDHRLQRSFVQQQLGHGVLQLPVFLLQLSQSPRLAHFHPAGTAGRGLSPLPPPSGWR